MKKEKYENAIMISVNPPYAQMISDGHKPIEFRKKVLKSMLEIVKYNEDIVGTPNIDIYIYETKNKGGSGKVICKCTLHKIYKVNYLNSINDNVLDYARFRNDLIKYLYLYWCIFIKNINPNLNEGWFKSKKFQKYIEEIGFDTNFNYGIGLSNIDIFDEPIKLSEFSNVNGDILNMPPQNMCNVILSKNKN